ncbi:MAG TPA: AI-2E family transporter [Flavisolibacter sp.]|nr:AI-2E family transporter [Flavisolibacter sp.]
MTDHLAKAVKLLLLFFLLAMLLHHGRPFLVPLTFAALLSMLLLPVTLWLEKKGWGKAMSVLASVLLLIIVVGGILTVLGWQVSNFARDAASLEQNINLKLEQVKDYIDRSFGISERKQEEIIREQQQSSGNKLSSVITGSLSSVGLFLTNSLLVLVYIFLFMYFRTHLKKFLLKLVKTEKQQDTRVIIENSRKVAQKYITGLALMIVCLWIMYAIGFSIVGVKYAIFFAILCGLLEVVPFVGNLAGNLLTVLMTLAQGGSMGQVAGILATYALVQFIQSYLIEPLVVGREVNINPIFTIVGIVAGEFIWGIPGMILAIPLIGIIKIVCDHIEPLKPYGFLLGEEKGSSNSRLTQKIKGLFQRG